MKCFMTLLVLLLAAGAATFGYFRYMENSFPEVRCEAAKHLDAPDMMGDCLSCHEKATPKVAQDWTESKHGMNLVRCQTCHGMPDGEGSLPFARDPELTVCAACHSSAMERMEAKFGAKGGCNTCHPHHQNSMHGDAYQVRTETN